jgi:peptidoglycan/xylan/chitin deacetylase (PgdA/CDA1 family)
MRISMPGAMPGAVPTSISRLFLRSSGRPVQSVAAASLLALALSACATYPVTSPREARNGAKAAAHVAKGSPDCREKKCVALSFDAGPSAHTPRLLKILKRYDAHATFMMLGKNHVMKHPATVRRIAAEGHELGNHTWSHRVLTDIEPAEARKELARTQEAVERIAGRRPVLMRPPQGRTDQEVTKASRRLGLSQVLWSVTAKDYRTNQPSLIRKRVLAQTRRDGIILLHDIYRGTVPAVPGILKELRQRGDTVVTVSQLLSPAKPVPGLVYRP